MTRRFRLLIAASAVTVALAAALVAPAGPASRISGTTTVGTHNTYAPASFTYLARRSTSIPG